MKSNNSKFKSMSIVAIIATMDLLLSGQGMAFASNTPPPMGQITGKVTLSSSSLGVANATVIVLDGNQNIIGEATTGADGSYSVAFPQSEQPATLKADAVGYQEYSGTVSASNGNGTDNISLMGQGNVKGIVLNQSNSPVSGATISVIDGSGNTLATTTSASDGSYSLSGVPAGIITLQASVQHFVSDTETEDVSSTSTSTVNFNINLNYGIVQGTITDGNNNNVGGAAVSLIDGSGHVVTTVYSNANGAYSIGNVTPGQYTVKVSANGYQTVTQNETVGDGQTVQADIALQSNSNSSPSITGTVTDGITGKFVAGATVTIKNSQGSVVGTAMTGDGGSYTIIGLPAGSYSETLSANNYETTSQSNIAVTTEKLTTVNNTMMPYTGKCLGAVSYNDSNNTPHPISGAKVSILDSVTGNIIGQSVTTDSKGNYSISNIPVGTYSVEVQADNFADSITQNLVVQKNQTSVKDVTLSADYGSVTVKVSDKATNNPVNANVQILDSSDNPVTGSVLASGQYTFNHIQAGNLTVVVDADGYIESKTPITVSSKQAAVADVALSTGNVTVTGTVTSASNHSPIAGATIEALNDNSTIIASVDTGADGTYSLAGIPSDGCTLRVVANGYAESQQTLTSVDSSTKQDFELEKAPFTDLQGQVEVDANNPIAGATVTLLDETGSPTGKTTTTDGNGNYSFADLPQDSIFSIQVDADGYVSKTITNVPTGTQDIQLQASTGTVFGTVSDSSGNLITSYSYSVDLISSAGALITTSSSIDNDGSFKFSNVPVGTYSVKVKIAGNVVASKTNQTVVSGKTTTENIVLADATGTIVGSVIDSSTQNALSGAKITLLDGNSKQVGYAVITKTDGTFEIQNVSVGDYSLQVSATGYATNTISNISVSAVGTTQEAISMTQNGAIVSGTVTSDTGATVSGASVSLVNSLGRIVGTVVKTDSSGQYTFTNVPLDTYTIEVYDQNYKSASLAGQTISSGTNTISPIQLGSLTQSNYSGKVIDPDGNPISTATITLMNSNHEVIKVASTDVNGNFSLQNISKKESLTLVIRANGYYTRTLPLNWNVTSFTLYLVE
jgi:large repetitive protein